MAWSLKKALGWDSSPYVKGGKKEDELFDGVPKPTEVLVGMIIATMQKDLKRIKGTPNIVGFRPTDSNIAGSWSWTNDFLDVSWGWKRYGYSDPYGYSNPFYDFEGLRVRLKGKTLTLSDNEKTRLKKALKEAMNWKWNFDKNKEEMDRQQEAVNLIEEFFKPKEKKVTEEDSPKEARAEPEEEPNQLSQMIS